jgi:hypothetical protein
MRTHPPWVVRRKRGVIQWSASSGSQIGLPKDSPKPHGTPIKSTHNVISIMKRISEIAQRKFLFAWNVASIVIIPSRIDLPAPVVIAF